VTAVSDLILFTAVVNVTRWAWSYTGGGDETEVETERPADGAGNASAGATPVHSNRTTTAEQQTGDH